MKNLVNEKMQKAGLVVMKVVLIVPKYPDHIWDFRYTLKFTTKKMMYAPLSLLTIAAMLPTEWDIKLIDMNIYSLIDEDIVGADFVFISALSCQKENAQVLISHCQKLGVKVVAGGALFIDAPELFDHVDHLILSEGEITLPLFLEDLRNQCPKHIYRTETRPDLSQTPIPRWDLVKHEDYINASIQFSRGCPFVCDFCEISYLYGNVARTKTAQQIIAELDYLYTLGWRGNLFFVDDNFIGNKQQLKTEILPAMISWMQERNYPYFLSTQLSINIVDDDELIHLMTQAGFDLAFIGIETINEESLSECNKHQNKQRDLVASVKKLQQSGIRVIAGFIVGFDSDPSSIFTRQIAFLQESGICFAMISLLTAVKGTKLFERMRKEKRILNQITGYSSGLEMNFISKMPYEVLLENYNKMITTIYEPQNYYQRLKNLLTEYQPAIDRPAGLHVVTIATIIKIFFNFGIIGKEQIHFWKLLFWTLRHRPKSISYAINDIIVGNHLRRAYQDYFKSRQSLSQKIAEGQRLERIRENTILQKE